MSEILRQIRDEFTGIRKSAIPGLRTAVKDTTQLIALDAQLDIMHEYSIRVEYGYLVSCRPKDLGRMKKNVIRSLQKEMYKDFERILLKFERAFFEDDRKMMEECLTKLFKEIGEI